MKKCENFQKDENRVAYVLLGAVLTLFTYTIIKVWELLLEIAK